VQDGATVPIYYESRLAELALDEPTPKLAFSRPPNLHSADPEIALASTQSAE
jgi:hypothetical protein